MSPRRTLARSVATLLSLTTLAVCLLGCPQTASAQEPVPVSVTLSGWGWCVAYRDIGSVSAELTGYKIPRENTTEVEDIYLEGTLTFNTPDITDNFSLELRGTKMRSLFFLKQLAVGEDPMIIDMMAEFEGTWLGETDYVACEGRISLTAPNHAAKPYFFILRTRGVEVPEREPGGWVGNLEFAIQKLTGAFDEIADRLSDGGSVIKEAAGELLMQTAVLARELRGLGIPYLI